MRFRPTIKQIMQDMGNSGNSPAPADLFMAAMISDETEKVLGILREGTFDINAPISRGSNRTPLMAAVQYERSTIISALISMPDIDVNKTLLPTEDTALHMARSPDTTRLLINAGASLTAENKYGYTPYLNALRFHYKEVAAVLLEMGSTVHAEMTGIKNFMNDPFIRPEQKQELQDEIARQYKKLQDLCHKGLSYPVKINKPFRLKNPLKPK